MESGSKEDQEAVDIIDKNYKRKKAKAQKLLNQSKKKEPKTKK